MFRNLTGKGTKFRKTFSSAGGIISKVRTLSILYNSMTFPDLFQDLFSMTQDREVVFKIM